MEKITLGRTALSVFPVGLGGIPITRLPFEDAVRVVRHCFDAGITFYDTANAYGDSERKIGHGLAALRSEVVLASKTLARDAKSAAEHVEQSHSQLRTERIDLYQIHQVGTDEILDQVLAPGGAYEAIEAARSDGRIGFVGLTSHNLSTAIRACRTGRFDTIQVPFNFVEYEPAEELFEVAKVQNMGIIAMKPLGGGLLQRADLCFRFLQQYPQVLPIPGIEEAREVDEILEIYRDPRPLDNVARLEIERIRSELGKRFCHRCEYCMPCKNRVQIPGILRFKSVSKRFPPATVISMSAADMETLERCDECWECAQKCPYDLPIPDLLKENLALFRRYTETRD